MIERSKVVDIRWLGAFRIAFGLTMAVSALRFITYGWVDEFFVKPTFHFTYFGFGWLPVLGASSMHALFFALFGLALLVAFGLFYRVAAPLFFVGFAYLQLVDVATYLNHYYLATLFAGLLALSPAHRVYSLDVRFGLARASQTIPATWLHLFRFQVAVVYTFAGLAKFHTDWLVHAEPLSIWLGGKTHLPLIGKAFTWPGMPLAMSWAGFLFDASVPWFLSFARTRRFAYVVVVAFHGLTRLLFPIGMFPVIMVLGALVFFDPSWPRRFEHAFERMFGARREADTEPVSSLHAPYRPFARHGLRLAVALYALVQVAVPLRFLAYGGNVRWHEQGMRFSWRVMVREKNGTVTFIVKDATGRERHVLPRSYLTPLQEREMASQPDLILQLAHHVKSDFEARGSGPVEVRVRARASLNGRAAMPLIDESVDLGSVVDGLAKAHWIAPAPVGAPPHVRPIG